MITDTQIQSNHLTDPIAPAPSAPKAEPRLQDLIPIAAVIVGGCESCAENMVARALKEGSSWEDIDKTLRILAGLQKLDCFAKAIGPEVINRMNKPIAAAHRTLSSAMRNTGF